MSNQRFKIGKLEIRTRPCKKSDYSFVFSLTKEHFSSYVRKYNEFNKKKFDNGFKKDFNRIIILLRGKRRIGVYQLSQKRYYLDVIKIYISHSYQRKGIGRQLMQYFETLGFKKIKLQVWDSNPAYKYFYKKLGYKIVAKKKHKYHMEKTIL